MAWRISFARSAAKQLDKLDPPVRRKILRFLDQKVAPASNPCQWGKPLQGQSTQGTSMWRYRTGEYRILCEIRDEEILILVLRLGHRKNIYR